MSSSVSREKVEVSIREIFFPPVRSNIHVGSVIFSVRENKPKQFCELQGNGDISTHKQWVLKFLKIPFCSFISYQVDLSEVC